jgi:O-antigen/teichoic acid export membrane protein
MLTTLVTLATVAATLRYLGAVEAGTLYAGLSALALAAGFSEFGLSSSSVRDYVNTAVEQRRVFLAQLIRLRLALLLPGAAVVLVYSLLRYDDEVALGLALGASWYALLILYGAATVPLTAELRSGTLALAQVTQAVSALAVTLGLVAAGAPTWLFFGVQTPGLVLCLTVLYARIPAARPQLRGRGAKVLQFDRPALVLGLASIVVILYYRSGALAVQLLAGLEAAGEYGAAFRMFDVAESVAPLMLAVVLPVLAQGSQDGRFDRRFGELLRVMTVFGAVGTTVAVILAPAAVRLVAGEEFSGAALPLQVMSAGLLAAFVGQTFGFALLSRKHHATMLAGATCALLTTLVTLVTLVPQHGAVGAAVALLLGQLVLTGVYVRGYRRNAASPVDLRVLVHAATVAAAAVAAGLLVPGPLVLRALTAALVLALAIPGTGLLTWSGVRALLR